VKIFGIGPTLDTYYLAFKIPDLMNVFYSVFLGSVIFIPLLTKAKKESEQKGEPGEKGIIKEVSKVGSLVIILVTSVAVIFFVAMPLLANFLAPTWEGEQLAELVKISRILLLAQFFFPIGILAGAIGMVYEKPLGMAISGPVYNFFILMSAIFLTPYFGIYGVVYGVVLGSVFFAAVQVYPKIVRTIYSEFKFEISRKEWQLFFVKNIGRFVSVLLNQAFGIIILTFASLAGSGGVTIFNNAFNIFLASYFVMGASFSTAMIPKNSQMHVDGEHEKLKDSLQNSLIYMFFLSIVFATFSFVFSKDIITILYYYSNLTSREVLDISFVFASLTLSIPLLNTIEVLRKYMYSTNLIKQSMVVMGSFVTLLILFNFILKFLGFEVLQALTLAIFFSNIFTVVIVFNVLNYLKKIEIKYIFKNIYKSVIISLLSLAVYKYLSFLILSNIIFMSLNYLLQLIILVAILFSIFIVLILTLNDMVGKNILRKLGDFF
jgi:putative peptidoglycan lipid II flippase